MIEKDKSMKFNMNLKTRNTKALTIARRAERHYFLERLILDKSFEEFRLIDLKLKTQLDVKERF